MTVSDIVPDRDQISQYVMTTFAAAPLNSIVALRSYYDDAADGPPFELRYERIQDATDLECVVDTAYRMAKAAAECPRPVVLCPPLATFTKRTAKTADLAAGLVLTVECDERAQEAKRILTAILGTPSLVVASGGQWIDPDTGELRDKLHLHWVLREPAVTPDGFKALRRLRELACDLVGADATSKSIVHPIRCPGSVHRKNEPRLCRIVEQSFSQLDLHEALAELEGLQILRDGVQQEQNPQSKPGDDGTPLADELVAGCAERIPNDDVEWAEWNRIAMAFYRASGGSAEGFTSFDTWSRRSGKYDAETTKARWEHFATAPPDRIGAGTLVYLARKVDPDFMRRKPRASAANGPGPGPAEDGGDPIEPFRMAVEMVNKTFFVVQIGGSVVIGSYQVDGTLERETLYFIKTADFVLKYRSRSFLIGYSLEGKPIWKDLGTAWLQSSMRREYDRAEMNPRGDSAPDVLNLWRGWGCVARRGSWRTIAEHILVVICGGKEDHYLYLIRLLARWVQRPEERGEVAIVLRGKKGTGKGSLAQILIRIFRHHAIHISQAKHLTGHFNAHLADCLFLFADETIWGGDKQADGPLKALVTEKAVHIEPKGVNSFQMPNRLKIMMASNAEWTVPVSEEERRYLVLDVLPDRIGDAAYFTRLHCAIEGSETEAMLHDLLALDLSDFNHRAVPHTDGLNAQKIENLDSVGKWWMDCLSTERIVGGVYPLEDAHWPSAMTKAAVHGRYVLHAQSHGDRHPRPEHVLGKKLKQLAPSIRTTKPFGEARQYLFQSVEEHRAEFCKAMRIDRFDWNEDDVEAATSRASGTRF